MNDAEQTQLGYRFKQALNESVAGLPTEVIVGLRENRQAALANLSARQHRPITGLSDVLTLAGHPLRVAAITMALSLGMVGTYYWEKFDQANEYEEIDSALLSDELPPEIYTDSGFHSWLEQSR